VLKDAESSNGPERKPSSGSPPGSSSTMAGCPRCSVTARGRAAHAASSSALNEYSYCSFLTVSAEGGLDEGASSRIDAEPGWLACSPRKRVNSSPSRTDLERNMGTDHDDRQISG